MFKKKISILLSAFIIIGTLSSFQFKANANGINGWHKNGTVWNYYANGSKVKGWKHDGLKWYFLNRNGDMQTGWLLDGSKWYLLSNNGEMTIGWVRHNGKWYFLNIDGSLVINTTTPDGYRVDNDGAWDGTPRTTNQIAKIKITSTALTVTTNGITQIGRANYAVYDYYGNNITTSSSTNGSITFQSSIGTITANNGLITITSPNINLSLNTSVTITAAVLNSGISTTATLPVTTQTSNTTQQVAKINITSTQIVYSTVGNNQIAYFTYNVLDQNGNNITNSAIASNLTFQSSIGTITGSNGTAELVVPAGSTLAYINSLAITINNPTNGVSTSATLPVISQTSNTTQQVAKINITSTQIVYSTVGNNQIAYFTYNVLDQNGNNITNSAIASNLTFQSSIGTITGSNGTAELVIPAGSTLAYINSLVITINNPTNGVSTSATLPVISQNYNTTEISKINITSTQIVYSTVGNNQVAYFTYNVLDQNGNNITNSAIASNLTFQSSIGTITGSNGTAELVVPAGSTLAYINSLVITINNPTNGVSTSAKLPVISQN